MSESSFLIPSETHIKPKTMLARHNKQSFNKKPKQLVALLVKLLSLHALITLLQQQQSHNTLIQGAQASGVFEINFSSLVDSYGRDLRDDCCCWQNQTSSSSMLAPSANNNQYVECDPAKCQLIIRICVKNYQTQIDPNQCTFGELSAQVMKPNEPTHQPIVFHNHPIPVVQRSTLPTLQQQQYHHVNFKRQPSSTTPALPTNIHHQRMLYQQQHQTPHQVQTHPQQHSKLYPSAIPSNTAYGNNHNYQTFLTSGQPRAMRTIAFHQPITFPFNYTWPVSLNQRQYCLHIGLHKACALNLPFKVARNQSLHLSCKIEASSNSIYPSSISSSRAHFRLSSTLGTSHQLGCNKLLCQVSSHTNMAFIITTIISTVQLHRLVQ